MKTKRLLFKLSAVFIILTSILILIFDTSPLFKPQQLTINNVSAAKQVVKKIVKNFASTATVITLPVKQKDLDAITQVVSFTVPRTSMAANISPLGLNAAISLNTSFLFFDVYLNFYCIVSSDDEALQLYDCQLGSLPLPSLLVKNMGWLMARVAFGEQAANTYDSLFKQSRFEHDTLILVAHKSADFRQQVKSSMKDTAQIVRAVTSREAIDSETLAVYLAHLETLNFQQQSIAPYIGELFTLALHRTAENGEVIKENTAALWAITLGLGSHRFVNYVDIKQTQYTLKEGLTLRGRHDLVLHFVYSIFLEQLGKQEVGLKIGELKELLDTGTKGSGFSFADLAADKAGLQFAQLLSQDEDEALTAQQKLAGISDESFFFPVIDDLPESIDHDEFIRVFKSVDSVHYKRLSIDIDNRIRALPLFKIEDADGEF